MNNDNVITVRAWIKNHPEHYRQTHWALDTGCGTAYCIAGVTISQLTDSLITLNATDYHDRHYHQVFDQDGRLPRGMFEMMGLTEEVPARAAELLGLTTAQALELFEESNTLEQIDEMLAAWMDVDLEVFLDKVDAAAADGDLQEDPRLAPSG
jgi:hypothetical protein